MLQIVYVSKSSSKLSEKDIGEILSKSRENNARLGVTGMLVYKDGSFMQVVEGPEVNVRQLYDKIESDRRHNSIVKILERELDERDFPNWKMGFKDAGKLDITKIPGHERFARENFTSKIFLENPSVAHQILLSFRDID